MATKRHTTRRKNGEGTRLTNADRYQMFTDRVVKALDDAIARVKAGEKVQLFWQRPWVTANYAPRNLQSGRPYHGFNVLLLALETMDNGYTDPRWTTMRGANKLGGKVRKGQHATWVTLWKKVQANVENDEGESERKQILLLRAYMLFNVEQIDWPEGVLKPWEPEQAGDWSPREEAEQVVSDYLASEHAPTFDHKGGNRAFYNPFAHNVSLPKQERFRSAPGYYSTLYHELVHSTGHESVLNRVDNWDRFGSEPYAREELVAELGAGMLVAHVGVDDDHEFENTVAYIDGWRKRISEDPKLILQAATKAQEAADRILGITRDYDNGNGNGDES